MNPIRTFPKNGSYAILFIKSGYTTTPLRCEVARYDAKYRPLQPWVNYANDSVYDSGGTDDDLVGWLPLPEYDEKRETDSAIFFGADHQWRCKCWWNNHELRITCRNCKEEKPR